MSQAATLQAVPSSTDLAFERTRMAAERTLIAWIRTALSMISFGFTIFKFLQAMQDSQKVTLRPHGPRNLGLTLIALGISGLITACIQHRSLLKQLHYSNSVGARWSLAMTVAVVLALLGMLAFANIALNMGPLADIVTHGFRSA